MLRMKIYNVDWDKYLNKLCSYLINYQYNKSKKDRFIVLKKREHYLKGIYIQKIETIDEIINPITNEISTYTKITYDENNFILNNNSFGLILINPTKKFRDLTNKLSIFTKFNISISNFNINLTDFFSYLESKTTDFTVKSMNVITNNSDDITANVIVKSSNTDTREYVKKLLNNEEYIINKSQCKLFIDNHTIDFEITSALSVKSKDDNLNVIIGLIEEYLNI